MIEYQLKNPILYGNLFAIRRKIYRPIARLDAAMLKSAEPIPFEEAMQSAFTNVDSTARYGRIFSCAWIRLKGAVPQDAVNPVLLLRLSGEAQIYSNKGEILGAVTAVWAGGDVRRSAGWRLVSDVPKLELGHEIDLLLDCGYNGFDFRDVGQGTFRGAMIAERDEACYGYYYDYFTLLLLFSATKDTADKAALRRMLTASFTLFSRGDTAGARRTLAPRLSQQSESSFTYSAIGHGHLDLAWLWPLRESMRKAKRTLSIALNNMEKYDWFQFGSSQPQQLDWVKQQSPEVYARAKQAVAEGKLEPQGGFWVECDCNVTSGESLIRQAVYGKQFMQNEFGKQMRMCWLPDAFGFNGNLPQILRGCGMEYFSTIKLSWNQHYLFPYRTFWWEGIDGTRVLVHMPPEGDYNSAAGAHNLLRGLKRYPEKELDTGLLVFGSGDGGGGPKESHLELLSRETSLKGLPKVKFESAIDFFDRLKTKEIDHVWKGELYLDVHQGTYTTQSETKRHNRMTERLLHEAEALDAAFGDGGADAKQTLDTIWKETLLYQFHDILPGSSIGRVYAESHARYEKMEQSLAERIESRLPRGDKRSAVNLSPFYRSEHVNDRGDWYSASVAPYAASELLPFTDKGELTAGKDTLSNGNVTLRFDSNGEIVSFHDRAGKEHAKGALNRLTLYRDHFADPYNAWNIDPNYRKKPRRTLRATFVSSRVEGPFAIRTQTYQTGKSRVEMRILLEQGSDTVRIETKINWHETHRMLRADFYPEHYGDTASFGIQFGAIQRSTQDKDAFARSQFEVCAHRYAAVQKTGAGFAVLCDTKYGYYAKHGLISLNLLRSPVFPDPNADRGEHTIVYAFCPVGDDLSHAVEEGYRLGYPLKVGAYAPFESIARSTNPAVVLETIKRSEDGEALVLRLYESLGRETDTAIQTSASFERARLSDLLEHPMEEANLCALHFRAYEIKTIRLEQARF